MKYALRVEAFPRSKRVDITEEMFNELTKARAVLSSFFYLTENYRVLLEAYQRAETVRHDVALSHILHGFSGYAATTDARVTLDSALIAYLASARYYIDSSNKLLSDL